MIEVRAITIRNPWAWAVVEPEPMGKNIENRSPGFPSRFRGPVLIHAGSAWSGRGAADERVLSLWVQGSTHGLVGPLQRSRFQDDGGSASGAVLGVADLVDVHPATPACVEEGGACWPWGELVYTKADGSTQTGVVHLVLENVRRLPNPIPARGILGLWRPASSLVTAVSSELQLAGGCQVCPDGLCGWCFHGWPALPAACGCHTYDEETSDRVCPRCDAWLQICTVSTEGRLDSPARFLECSNGCGYDSEIA